MRMRGLVAAGVLLAAAVAMARPPRKDSEVTAALKRDAEALAGWVETPWVKTWLEQARLLEPTVPQPFFHDAEKKRYFTEDEARRLPESERASLVRREVGDDVYWGRYSTPIAYARAFDVAG